MYGEAEKPEAGAAIEIAGGVRRVLAPNPGAMTHWGTNTYVFGTREVAVLDPGPMDPAHLTAVLAAIGGAPVRAVLVTHAHRDHSAGARALALTVDAPVFGYGAPSEGRSAIMQRFAASGGIGGGEGVDDRFSPDITMCDGTKVDFGDGTLTALHTPGHFGGHLAFAFGDLVMTGDVVMGWSTTLISPPDGDVRDFFATCARLRAWGADRFLPGHGAPVSDPSGRLDWLVSHRRSREAEVIAALSNGRHRAHAIAATIYRDLAPELLPAAERNVLAHLLDLHDRGLVTAAPSPVASALWSLA